MQSATVSQQFEMIQLKLTYFNHRNGHLHHPEPLKFVDSFTVLKTMASCQLLLLWDIQRYTKKHFWYIYKIYKYIQRKNEWDIVLGFCYWKYLLKRLLECVYISFYINRYITFTWARQRSCKREDKALGPQKPITVPLQQQGNENQLKAQLILIFEGMQHQNTCHTLTF